MLAPTHIIANYAIPLDQYLTRHKVYTNVIIGACIFSSSAPNKLKPKGNEHDKRDLEQIRSNPGGRNLSASKTQQKRDDHGGGDGADQAAVEAKELKILLLRRAKDERSFPNRWECPGGSVEPDDPTILHSLAREVKEETGLCVERAVEVVGTGTTFKTRKGTWQKLHFLVDVFEHDPPVYSDDEGPGVTEDISTKVTPNPREHQACGWFTQAEVMQMSRELTTRDQFDTVLQAFQLFKSL